MMNISHDGILLPPPLVAVNGLIQECYPNPNSSPNPNPNPNPNPGNKRKRNSSRELDGETEVVALSPKSLMATYRFICEICNKGFQRDQNLQLHRRGHNLPWKLKQRPKDEIVKKKVYVCPEVSCVHHHPSRALGDLTGIKKHFSRKHGDRKWNCHKCPKKYAVMSDLKAHAKICGTREYKCDCGTVFSRKDSFITHRAFCDALTEERMRNMTANMSCSSVRPNSTRPDLINGSVMTAPHQSASQGFFPNFPGSHRLDFMGLEASSSNGSNSMGGADGLVNKPRLPMWLDHHQQLIPEAINNTPEAFLQPNLNLFVSSSSSPPIGINHTVLLKEEESLASLYSSPPSFSSSTSPSSISATALLQRAAPLGSNPTRSDINRNPAAMYAVSAFNDGGINLHQRHFFGQQMNGQSIVVEQAYINSALTGDGYENGSRQQGHNSNTKSTSTGVGMRDFLGGLGGNINTSNAAGGDQTRPILQQEMTYTKFTTNTMAAASHHDHHNQEPYMDFMR